jgi:lipopolysaccharide heptosyltransferase II
VKILLVRLRLIGDVVFTTPLIAKLRRHLPDASIAYVVEPSAAPVVERNPHLNDVIVTPRRSGFLRLRDDLATVRRLRRGRFDVAIDLHGGPRSAWLTWMSGAPRRIGYRIPGRSWMYTDVVHRSPELAPRHSVLNQSDLLAPLGIDACDPAREPLEMPDDRAVEARVAARLRDRGIGPDQQIAVIHVSAGNPFRRWPPRSFAAVAAALIRRDPTRRVILVSGPADREAAQAVVDAARAELGSAADALSVGEYDLAELRALVGRAAVYIGGDSGPLHVAATTCSPIVELLGPTLAERSQPWRDARWFSEVVEVGNLSCRPCDQRRCAPGDFRCLTGISPSRVVDAAERAMATRHALVGER